MTQHPMWKPVIGFEGYYEVSDDGLVRSIDRITCQGHHLVGRIRKPAHGKYGHALIGLAKDGVVTQNSVHVLVLAAFVGQCPNGMECCHYDGNPRNNKLENLRWDTRIANNKDRIRHGTAPRGEKNPAAKMNTTDVERIRDLRRFDYSQQRIADWLGVGRRMISHITTGQAWNNA